MSPLDFLQSLQLLGLESIGDVEFTVIFRSLAPDAEMDMIDRSMLKKAIEEFSLFQNNMSFLSEASVFKE